jgi:hypothetical protein
MTAKILQFPKNAKRGASGAAERLRRAFARRSPTDPRHVHEGLSGSSPDTATTCSVCGAPIAACEYRWVWTCCGKTRCHACWKAVR